MVFKVCSMEPLTAKGDGQCFLGQGRHVTQTSSLYICFTYSIHTENSIFKEGSDTKYFLKAELDYFRFLLIELTMSIQRTPSGVAQAEFTRELNPQVLKWSSMVLFCLSSTRANEVLG